MTMGGGGNYADPEGAILDDAGRHPLGPSWRIRLGNHSCSRQEVMATAEGFVATHSKGTAQLFWERDSKRARPQRDSIILMKRLTEGITSNAHRHFICSLISNQTDSLLSHESYYITSTTTPI